MAQKTWLWKSGIIPPWTTSYLWSLCSPPPLQYLKIWELKKEVFFQVYWPIKFCFCFWDSCIDLFGMQCCVSQWVNLTLGSLSLEIKAIVQKPWTPHSYSNLCYLMIWTDSSVRAVNWGLILASMLSPLAAGSVFVFTRRILYFHIWGYVNSFYAMSVYGGQKKNQWCTIGLFCRYLSTQSHRHSSPWSVKVNAKAKCLLHVIKLLF